MFDVVRPSFKGRVRLPGCAAPLYVSLRSEVVLTTKPGDPRQGCARDRRVCAAFDGRRASTILRILMSFARGAGATRASPNQVLTHAARAAAKQLNSATSGGRARRARRGLVRARRARSDDGRL